jgi:hypothetical protein
VVCSVLLHILYAGPLSLLPIVVDAVLIWAVFIQQWRLPAA